MHINLPSQIRKPPPTPTPTPRSWLPKKVLSKKVVAWQHRIDELRKMAQGLKKSQVLTPALKDYIRHKEGLGIQHLARNIQRATGKPIPSSPSGEQFVDQESISQQRMPSPRRQFQRQPSAQPPALARPGHHIVPVDQEESQEPVPRRSRYQPDKENVRPR
mmetsp:Transcript_24118/g.57230  ORF Transcript_24118/g.57230 Transcript_24118/m.57230 type:complete len:161 (+) Transcript_24118:1-483(+)